MSIDHLDRATMERSARATELRAAIDGITAQLRVPGLSNLERTLLNADRHDLRAELADLFPAKPEVHNG